mgnify:CR=1 FL=1
MLVLKRVMDTERLYFIPNKSSNKLENEFGVSIIKLTDFSKLYKPYYTSDILIVDDDPMIRSLFIQKLSKYKIKSEESDPGRNIEIDECKSTNQLLRHINDYKCTYGLIVIEEHLGPDSLTGTQVIKRIRDSGYEGAILSITGDNCTDTLVSKIKNSGSNGILTKGKKDFFTEISMILSHLTTRNFQRSI